jgi:hypothetical protein
MQNYRKTGNDRFFTEISTYKASANMMFSKLDSLLTPQLSEDYRTRDICL